MAKGLNRKAKTENLPFSESSHSNASEFPFCSSRFSYGEQNSVHRSVFSPEHDRRRLPATVISLRIGDDVDFLAGG
jgi:hypothetical protein